MPRDTLNTPETPITKINIAEENSVHFGSHAWQFCKCAKCGVVELCTPWFDFATVTAETPDANGDRPLYCKGCTGSRHRELTQKG